MITVAVQLCFLGSFSLPQLIRLQEHVSTKPFLQKCGMQVRGQKIFGDCDYSREKNLVAVLDFADVANLKFPISKTNQ